MKVNFRKTLIVFTPKSLLRQTISVSMVEDLTEGFFQRLIPDVLMDEKQVKKLVFCSGKFYYDLVDARAKKNLNDVAIVRIEQLFPLDKMYIKELIEKYNAEELVWVQEEPENMGAWLMIRHRLEKVLNETKKGYKLNVVARFPSAAPAGGYQKYHQIRQKEIVTKALEL